MKPILEIHNISKKFLIDHERPSYLSFRDRLADIFTKRPKPEEFWALRNVSFDVMPGESIGIIGRNGAGKSTLLKILSRITPPTEGHIVARGRVASLLEVGTGFHQELTGRENIFMNGSILGMKRAEIKKRFDEIVDFSGVEKFLDTPLKHYSSGMQLRLAFAVAAHLEPEILIIDEVLAVGDAEFQKKCLGKMEEVNKMGRTILFVSHNLEALANLCQTGLYIKQGEGIRFREISQAINNYSAHSDFGVQIVENEVVDKIIVQEIHEALEIVIHFSLEYELTFPNLGFVVRDQFGHPLFGSNPMKSRFVFNGYKPIKNGTIKLLINKPKLIVGTYQLMIWLGDGKLNFFTTQNPIFFKISDSTQPGRNPKVDGYIVPECIWKIDQ